MERICEICNKCFNFPAHLVKKGFGNFCSMKCYGKHRIGIPAWNKGLPTEMQPNFGKSLSEETKEKLRKAHLGKKMSLEARQKISLAKKGKLLGENNPSKRPEVRKKIGDANRGEKSASWKGDKVGYGALHDWVKSRLGYPKKCEHCKRTDKEKYEWANVSEKYLRDLSDWIRLCTSCHRKYDINKLRISGVKKFGFIKL